MKKAFSLFELVITIGLLGVIFVVFSKPLINMTRFYTNSNQSLISTSLVFIDKIIQNCLDFTTTLQGFECVVKDEANLVLQRQNNAFIGSSGIILRDENSNFYAPKSHFLYEIQGTSDKSIKVGVLENQKDMHSDKNKDFLYLYALKERQIHKVRIVNESQLAFMDNEFIGFYELVDAQVSVELKDNELIYRYNPYLQGTSYTNILAQNVKKFRIDESNDGLSVIICDADDFCLQKWVRR